MSSSGRVSNCQVEVENQAPLPPPSVRTTNMQTDGIKPLSGKPYFHVIIYKTQLRPRYAVGPSSNICSTLPFVAVPTILNCRGKSWEMIYNGQNRGKLFDSNGWGNFVKDNNLKLGDACVFELMEHSKDKIVFEVQILRGNSPFEFSGIGDSEEEPIVLSEFPGTGERDAPFVID
ncbi:B3 domain-containing protein [Trifolium repens]|nr:B3 domain-containing protein [Trifolium repens]